MRAAARCLTVSTALSYQRRITDGLELKLFGEANYSDEYYTVPSNEPLSRMDDYWMINLRAGVGSSDGRWSLMAYGRNLLDEDIVTTAFAANQALLALGDPRTYGIELTIGL